MTSRQLKAVMNRLTPLGLALTMAFGCNTNDTLLLESTTTEIPKAGATAVSADGRFRIVFEADSVPTNTEITIETIRDFDAEGLVSLVYRVGPKDLTFARDARAEYDLDRPDLELPLRFVRLDEDRTEVLAGSRIAAAETQMQADVRRLDRVLFAVVRRVPPPCPADACDLVCELCDPSQSTCAQPSGYCSRNGECRPQRDTACVPSVEPYAWNDQPARGTVFVINSLAFAPRDSGFDLDGKCSSTSCIDNILWRFGELSNDQIRQGVLGGESLILLELAGLEQPYLGDQANLTFKMYAGRDADNPFFPANNFRIPAGHTTCCEFLIEPHSVSGVPLQARARAPSRIERGRLRTLAPTTFDSLFTTGVRPNPKLKLERVVVSGRLTSDLAEMNEGIIGAVVPISSLASTENTYCRTVNPRCPIQFADSTMLDVVAALLSPRPDIDLDGDGLECVRDQDGDGAIDLCCDGFGSVDTCGGSACPGSTVPPLDPERPSSCAQRPEMADGYSVAYAFTAVRAEILGIAQ